MIKDEDCEFHTPNNDPMWAETNFFGFEVPEANLHIGLYTLFRPNLGIANSAVFANSRKVTGAWETDFWDHRAYLPIAGQKLTDFSLPNGLSVKNHDPNRLWTIKFDNPLLKVDVRYEALMVPFDIHDPDMDPMERNDGDDLASSAAWKDGHFDMTGAVTGTVEIRGQRYEVDWLLTMDHSWGVRGEYQSGTMTWLQAHFGRDLAVHGIFQFDPTTPLGEPLDLELSHGYVMDNGQPYGIKSGSGRTLRSTIYQEQVELELVDVRDKVHKLTGKAQANFPAEYWPGSMSPMAMLEWELDGRRGLGTTTDFYDYSHHQVLYSGHPQE